MKLVTFVWSVSIEAPDSFDSENPKQVRELRHDAWMNVQESDGDLTDEQPEAELTGLQY